MESKVRLLEDAIEGIHKKMDDLEKRIIASTNLSYAMHRFKKKRKAEAIIRKQLSQVIIPILKKLDLEKLNIFYEDQKKFKKAIDLLKEAMEALDYY